MLENRFYGYSDQKSINYEGPSSIQCALISIGWCCKSSKNNKIKFQVYDVILASHYSHRMYDTRQRLETVKFQVSNMQLCVSEFNIRYSVSRPQSVHLKWIFGIYNFAKYQYQNDSWHWCSMYMRAWVYNIWPSHYVLCKKSCTDENDHDVEDTH